MTEYVVDCHLCEADRAGTPREVLYWWTRHCMSHQWWWKAGQTLANAARTLKQVIA